MKTYSACAPPGRHLHQSQRQQCACAGYYYEPPLQLCLLNLRQKLLMNRTAAYCWLIGIIFVEFLAEMRSLVERPSSVVLDVLAAAVVICLTVFAYEVCFVSMFGATPGKMLFRPSVENTGNRIPTKGQSKKKSVVLPKIGPLMLFLPMLQILGAIIAWRLHDQKHPWAIAASTSVRQKPLISIRLFSCTLLAFCLVTFMVDSHWVLQQESREEISGSILR